MVIRIAFVPEKLEDTEIYNLAMEIAKLYMVGKTMGSSKDFIDTFLDVREAAAIRYFECRNE